MSEIRFDILARSLTTAGSRRWTLAATLGGALGLLGWHRGEDIAAHDKRDKCKKIEDKDKKKQCLKKAKKHNATHTTQTAPPPPPIGPSLAGTCTAGQADVCTAGLVAAANCNASTACSCYTTTAGARFCGEDQGDFCPTTGGCSTDAECQAAPGAAGTQAACITFTSPNGGGNCGECTVGSKSFCLRPCPSQP